MLIILRDLPALSRKGLNTPSALEQIDGLLVSWEDFFLPSSSSSNSFRNYHHLHIHLRQVSSFHGCSWPHSASLTSLRMNIISANTFLLSTSINRASTRPMSFPDASACMSKQTRYSSIPCPEHQQHLNSLLYPPCRICQSK